MLRRASYSTFTRMATVTRLQRDYPWTTSPLIVNGPMAGFAGSDLAIAVSKARGLGLIGTINDMDPGLASQLEKVSQAFYSTSMPPGDEALPVGVGILTFINKLEKALPVLTKYRPMVVWLFGAHELTDYQMWAKAVREALPKAKIWIQIGSVAGAVTIAELCKPDVIVLQGADAGGHGWEKGAGIISLLPEAADALASRGFGDIPLLAAGGIVDGRGFAAAIALGARGCVLGTRFLSAPETTAPHEGARKAILAAKDGGQNTVRSKMWDELRGPNLWPTLFDGRAIINESFTDHMSGHAIEELREKFSQEKNGPTAGYGIDGKGRAIVWAGTGVGLVNKTQPAAEIVEEIREEVHRNLQRLSSVL